jgi:hypothetical protein
MQFDSIKWPAHSCNGNNRPSKSQAEPKHERTNHHHKLVVLVCGGVYAAGLRPAIERHLPAASPGSKDSPRRRWPNLRGDTFRRGYMDATEMSKEAIEAEETIRKAFGFEWRMTLSQREVVSAIIQSAIDKALANERLKQSSQTRAIQL